MVDINTIKIRDYKPFKYKGFKIENIWKGYDEDDPEETYMWFDVIAPDGKRIEWEEFSRSTTIRDLKFFVKYALDNRDYFANYKKYDKYLKKISE